MLEENKDMTTMRTLILTGIISIAILGVANFPAILRLTNAQEMIAPCTANAATAEKKHMVVRLGHYTDDLHAAAMAVGFAKTLQERGQKVTLMLTLEGVRLADARTPQDLRWGHGEDIAKAYDGFRKAGGDIIVCPHCAEAAGIDEKSLRPGARLGKEGNDLVDVLIAADTVIDF
jgi:predicted peroxiredoxin